MKIYHGTSIRYLDKIKKEGIKPRGLARGNWGKKVQSSPEHVYLSTAYAIYFGCCAIMGDEEIVVFEINIDKLDKDKLYPDEDAIAQIIHSQHENRESLVKTTERIRKNMQHYQEHWENSLTALGNCSHKGSIPVKALTRYMIYSPKENIQILLDAMDPTITLINFKLLGEYYNKLIKFVFGDIEEYPIKFSYMFEEEKELLKKMQPNGRKGIKVVDLKRKVLP